MKILINYPKIGESGPAFTFELAKGLVGNGCDVYAVIAQNTIYDSKWSELLSDEHIYRINVRTGGSRLRKMVMAVRFGTIDQLKMRKKFHNIKFEFSLCTFFSYLSIYVNKFINAKKKVAICHDPVPHSGAKISQKKMCNFYTKSDDVFVLTKSFRKMVSQNFQIEIEHVHYIPHGRMNMYSQNEKYELVAKDYKAKYHFLFFGRIEEYKGLHVLAEAYRLVLEKTKDVELTILGSGDFDEYKDEYALLHNVHIINRYIKDDEIGNYFELPNTTVIVPYTDATQSGVIPIAYEFGTPVIASDMGGLREQLNDGRLGLLYQNNDAAQLAQCMMKIVNNPEIFKEQKCLMEEYRKQIDWTEVAKRLLESIKGEK